MIGFVGDTATTVAAAITASPDGALAAIMLTLAVIAPIALKRREPR